MLTPCTIKEYAAVLDFLDAAFEKQEKHWFAKNLEHIFQPTSASVACHRLCRTDGKLEGVIGIYPMRLRIGKAVLTMGGIGSVSVGPHSRGKGVMSRMLEQAIAIMEKEGYDISWLGGERYRYGNYGWDYGGRDARYTIRLKDLRRYYPTIKSVKLGKIEERDIPLIDAMYSRLGSAMPRERQYWKLQIVRRNYGWVKIEGNPDGNSAYLCHEASNPAEVLEIGGDRMGVVSLLLQHLEDKKIQEVRVHYPDRDKDPLDGLMHEVAGWFWLEHCHDLRVINSANAWKKLVPEMVKTPAGAAIGRKAFDKVRSDKDRRLVLKRALGFFDCRPPMPSHLRDFEPLQPLKWWLSVVDHV